MVSRALAFVVVLASIVLVWTGAPEAASKKPKSLTIAFAATGGTEHDTFKATYTQSPACTMRMDGTSDDRDVAWKVKWSHVKLPKRSKPVTKRVRATITGRGTTDMTVKLDPGCGTANPAPEHCEGPISVDTTAVVSIRRTASGYAVTADAAGAEEDSGGQVDTIEAAPAAAEPDQCDAGLRDAALHAEVRLPRKSARAVVVLVDATANESRGEERRPHFEAHDSESGMVMDMTSDVAWSGIVTSRFNRR